MNRRDRARYLIVKSRFYRKGTGIVSGKGVGIGMESFLVPGGRLFLRRRVSEAVSVRLTGCCFRFFLAVSCGSPPDANMPDKSSAAVPILKRIFFIRLYFGE